MAKGKLAVGLDIGSGSIKLCQLKPAKRGNYQLQAFGMVQLPPEAIVDGALMNSTAVVDGIQELFASQKIKHKEVATSVSGHSVIIKKINLPQMTAEELEESIQWEAEQYIPFDINDVNIDVQILNTESTQAGQMDVLLVAAKKDMVNDYTEVISSAGLTPVVVDIDAFAVQNQFEINYEVPRSETVVLVNIGASVTNINVLANGVSTFTRDISIGGGQFTDAVQKALNVSYDEAEALKLGGGTADSDAVVPQEVERVLQTESESIANEIQRSLDFYAATSADAHIARIFVSGGSAKIPALIKTIENRTGVPVEVMNPFRNIDAGGGRFDSAYLESISPMAAVAVGLALRYPADK
jgi:type IV pilus assembly protein PilM